MVLLIHLHPGLRLYIYCGFNFIELDAADFIELDVINCYCLFQWFSIVIKSIFFQ